MPGADVGRSGLGSLMGTSSQVMGVQRGGVAAAASAADADPSTSCFQGAELWADVDWSGPGLCADEKAAAGPGTAGRQVQVNGVQEGNEGGAVYGYPHCSIWVPI